ncbi:unnamed protein product [Parnassius mnemosyne]|uniref:MADF domain-containing protein n=1 Tax=Parnassius mnemosyne TaxID=213953 RepID=A0AAV1KJZ2_9NEOP
MGTEKLIMLVRERSFLYDVKNNDYKNRRKVAEAWLEIGREMGTENGKQWATKWKSLRDNYKKFKKATEIGSGPAYKKYKRWPWAEHLRFLDDTIALKETDMNIKSENRNSTSQVSDSDNQTRPDTSSGVYSQDSVSDFKNLSRPGTSNSAYSRNTATNKRRTQKVDSDAEQQLLKYLQEKNLNEKKLDDIDQLFQSYATSLKKLPARMQSMLKLDIAKLFAKYEMQVQDNINITPVNSPSTNSST